MYGADKIINVKNEDLIEFKAKELTYYGLDFRWVITVFFQITQR